MKNRMIVLLFLWGKSVKSIAKYLGISEREVQEALRNLKNKHNYNEKQEDNE